MSHTVRPPAITPSDVASMLALLGAATPYIDGERGRAYFKLGDPPADPFPDVFVALADGGEPAARQAAAEAVAALPELHAWVVGGQDDPDVIPDEYVLSHLEVEPGRISVCYTPTVNALWRNEFLRDEAGRWRPA